MVYLLIIHPPKHKIVFYFFDSAEITSGKSSSKRKQKAFKKGTTAALISVSMLPLIIYSVLAIALRRNSQAQYAVFQFHVSMDN